MKCLSCEVREVIRRAIRDGREARGNEERERREDEKGIVSSSPLGMTSWSSSIKIWFIFKLIECIIKMSWCETECKKCAIGEQNVID